MQDSASRERVSTKALIEDETMDGEGRAKQDARAENGCSIVEINNAGDDPLSVCTLFAISLVKLVVNLVLAQGLTKNDEDSINNGDSGHTAIGHI